MSAARHARSELAYTDSDCLCPVCHDLLYVDADVDKDLCFNAACPCYAGRGEIPENICDHEGPRQAEARLRQSVRGFCRFSRKFLFTMLYLERTHRFASFLKGQGLHGNAVSSIEYLMTQLAGTAVWGSSVDEAEYRARLAAYRQDFGVAQTVEALSSKTFLVTPAGKAFAVKYSAALEKFRNTLGITGRPGAEGRVGLHAFSFIDEKARGGPPSHVFDFGTLYKNFGPNAVSLNHMFRAGHAVSRMHMYPSESVDFEALRSLWRKCRPGRLGTVRRDELRHVYEGAVARNGMRGDFERFLRYYASGEKYAPVLVFDGEEYHFDYPTLLLYMAYIFSNNRTRSGIQTEAGSVTHGRARQEASARFEVEVRRVLGQAGFETHPGPDGEKFKPSFDGVRREFDCVAVDRDRKLIVLIEAKYRDISPSSMTGATLVNQLVLDKRGGLLGQADDHHERRQFFIRHFSRMKEFGLRLDGCFLDYTIHTLMVTKHEPLISRHKAVRLVSYDRFKSIDFRSTSLRDELDSAAAGPAAGPPGAAGVAWPAHGKRPHRAPAWGRRG